MSDYEESPLDPSDPETQFIPQEDDDETLWEVIEITAEKKKLYKVRWKGIDPKTQKPWPQSWVPKHDCTDDLVRNWKLRQARKKKKVPKREFGTSKETRAISSVKSSSSSSIPPPPPPRIKKKLDVISREHSDGSPEIDYKVRKRKSSNRVISGDDDDDYKESRAISTVKSSGSIPPPRKKKKLEVGVVSREHTAGSTEVENKGRKRKGSKRAIASDDDDNYVRRESKSEEEEEEDRRMVEESLSDIQHPRPPQEPTCNQEEENTPASPVQAQSPSYIRQDAIEESTPTLPQHEMDSLPTVLAITSPKPDPPNKKRTRPPSLSPSSAATKSHATTKHRTLSEIASRITARPKKRMKTVSLSKQEWEELNDFQSQQVTTASGMVPIHDEGGKAISETLPELDLAGMNLDHPVVQELNPPPPSERLMPVQASRSRAVSAAGSGSLSGREIKSIPPPISRSKEVGLSRPSATSPTRNVIPTTPLRKGSVVNGEEHGHKSPILSPRAKKRLEIFDREIELQRLDGGDKVKQSNVSRVEEGESGETVIAGGGRQEHGFQRTSEEKSWNGKDKEQRTEDKARTSTPQPPEVKNRKDAELSDASDSQDRPDLRPKESVGSEESQGVEADFVVERREEEESTQDLALELHLHQRQQGVGVGWSGVLVPDIINDTGDLLPAIQIDSQPISEAMLDTGVQNSGEDSNEKSDPILDEIPSIIVENPSRSSLTRSYSSLEDGDGHANRKTGPRTFKSRSRSRSVSSQRNKNDESDPDAIIPPTASTHRETLQESSQPVSQSSENPHYLGAAMDLLNIKSEEISKLEGQLCAEQRKNKDLLQQISALQLRLTEPSPNVTLSTSTVLEQELAEARAQLALQKDDWKMERAALVRDVEERTRDKVSAEGDRDLFREHYMKASAFVSSVRDENAELEKQMKIATNQAKSGVNLIKSTFKLRIQSLERDVHAWRRMTEFLVEKDRRTNDDIRTRAAEEPELRARCDRQKIALQDTSKRLLQFEVDLEEKEKMLLEEQASGKRWQEMTVKLNLELNEALTKLERIGKIGLLDGDEGVLNGLEFVYRCLWREDDSNDACEAVFLNISELQEHLYTGGHLQREP